MSVKQMSNGKWRVYIRYKDALGRPRQKKKTTFRTKHEAKRWEREYLAVNEGKALPDMRLDELAKRWLSTMKQRWRASTYDTVVSSYRLHIAPVLGQCVVCAIKAPQILAFHDSLLASQLKPVTKQKINAILSSIFRYGVKYCLLANNPTADVPLDCHTERRHYLFWTREQFEMFIHRIPDFIIKHQGPMIRLFFTLLFYSGMRRGEALALRFSDIDFADNIIHVTKSRGNYGIGSPKTTTSTRIIPMPKTIMKQVRDYMNKLYEPSPNALIFPFSTGNAQYYWSVLLDKYGQDLPRIRIHDLRHSHATMLLDAGISYQAVADRLGHTDTTQVIQTYGHFYTQRRREVADKLDDILNKKDD